MASLKSSKNSKPLLGKAIFALMLVLFIDGFGQGLIFPILSATIANDQSSLLLQNPSPILREIWYGVLVGVYYLMWFLSATVLGDWSDNVGRKKALLLCLLLATFGFAISALAFHIDSIWLLLFGRFLGGLTSGDQAIAQASVIDLCDPEKKSVYLGLVLLSVTLGLVIGPLIGSILVNSNFISWFGLTTPFYFATLFNIIILALFFSETHPTKAKKIQWTKAISAFTDAFKDSKIRYLLIAYLFAQGGWAIFYVYSPNYLIAKYHISIIQSGWFMALIGLGLGLGLGVLPSLWHKGQKKIHTGVAYLLMAAAKLIFIFDENLLPMWIYVVPATAFLGFAYANLLALFSEAVSAERQGWIMGVTGSVVALTAGVDSLLAGMFANMHINGPYIFSFICVVIGALMIFNYRVVAPPHTN